MVSIPDAFSGSRYKDFPNDEFFAGCINDLIGMAEKDEPKHRKCVSYLRKLCHFFSTVDYYVSFEGQNSNEWAQVTIDKRGLRINLSFPFNESFKSIFAKQNIGIPSTWKVTYFKKGKVLTFETGESNVGAIASFLSVVFIGLYRCPNNYKVAATFRI